VVPAIATAATVPRRALVCQARSAVAGPDTAAARWCRA